LICESSTVGLVVAHERIDTAHLGHDGIDRRRALRRISGPQLHRDARAHDGLVARHPLGARGRTAGCEERSDDAAPEAATRVRVRARLCTGARPRAIKLNVVP
jgi:hypothetical protein